MSRKSRNQRDKRAEAFDLARPCGHGTSFDDVADDGTERELDWPVGLSGSGAEQHGEMSKNAFKGAEQ